MSDHPSSSFVTNAAVDRMLGILIERTEGLREDTRELRTATASLHDVNASMRIAMERLTSEVTALIASRAQGEKISERVDDFEKDLAEIKKFFADDRLPATEKTVNRWERWIGKGWSFIGKLTLAFVASGVLSGSLFGAASKIASHWVP